MGIFKNIFNQKDVINKQNKKILHLERQLKTKDKQISKLKNLCETKDSYFKEMISDGLKHGSKLASKHMTDRKKYLNGK